MVNRYFMVMKGVISNTCSTIGYYVNALIVVRKVITMQKPNLKCISNLLVIKDNKCFNFKYIQL